MRDSYRQLEEKSARRESLMLRQFQFLESRQRALESVLSGLRWFDRVLFLFGFLDFKPVVDKAHVAMLGEIEDKMAVMVENVKAEMRRPKILIPGANGHG